MKNLNIIKEAVSAATRNSFAWIPCLNLVILSSYSECNLIIHDHIAKSVAVTRNYATAINSLTNYKLKVNESVTSSAWVTTQLCEGERQELVSIKQVYLLTESSVPILCILLSLFSSCFVLLLYLNHFLT